jgi:hypothetical protein
MAWKIKIGEKSMLLDDMSQDDFMTAVAEYPDANWLRLYMSPGAHPGAFYNVLCIAARNMEVPSPDRPRTVKDAVDLLKHIEQVDDDLPKTWSEGAVPLEEAVDPETTTSSTSTEPEDGRPSKREQRH